MKKKRIILSVINDLVGDQRIHRIATTLQEAGAEVWVVGRKLPDSLPLTPRGYQTHRMRLWFRKGKFFYLEYNIRLLGWLLFRRADVLTANDLDTLLANFLAARLKSCHLVYDSHEYFTEVPELTGRPATRRIWLWLERWIFPRLKTVYTVNQSLAEIYTAKYKVPVQSIRNLPFQHSGVQAKKIHPPILLYQGALNVSRGIELMIEAMEYLPEYQLWIVGKGDVEAQLHQLVRQKDTLQARVHFKGFVPFGQLADLTKQAHLGLSLEEDHGLNYRYASPNKLYDYIQAGIPVLVSDLPEMRRIVQTHKLGKVLAKADRTSSRLAVVIRSMLADEKQWEQWSESSRQAAQLLNWEKEQKKLLDLYAPLLN